MDRINSIADLAASLAARASGSERIIVAVAGPPGAGKSTLASSLVAALNAEMEPGAERACLAPMDGYHLDNAILVERGILGKKGAPESFDLDGYAAALRRIRDQPGETAFLPKFDRDLDLARAGAIEVAPGRSIIVAEGNYLLLDRPGWRALHTVFDASIWLDVDDDILLQRLIDRWLAHGHDEAAARKRALGNDMPNARFVKSHSVPADIVWRD